jgi:predicted AlkP superfamily pyrophosphatase or phosphodiesterase
MKKKSFPGRGNAKKKLIFFFFLNNLNPRFLKKKEISFTFNEVLSIGFFNFLKSFSTRLNLKKKFVFCV